MHSAQLHCGMGIRDSMWLGRDRGLLLLNEPGGGTHKGSVLSEALCKATCEPDAEHSCKGQNSPC